MDRLLYEKSLELTNHNWDDNQPIMVSIIVAAYNHEKYIAQAIEGFLMQRTNFKVEILINEDASKDATACILKSYENKYPNLFNIYYQQENQYSQGVKPWFHILFPAAKGKYIAICDGDDYWTDVYKLQKQVDFLEVHNQFSFSAHSYEVIRESGYLEQKFGEENKINYLEFNPVIKLEQYIKTKSIKTLTILFRSEFLKKGTIFSDSFSKLTVKSSDWLWFYKLLALGDCKVFPEVMGAYRINSNGVSQQKGIPYIRTNLICLIKTLDFALMYDQTPIHLDKKKILFKNITRLMYYSIRSKKNIDLFKYYLSITYKYILKK